MHMIFLLIALLFQLHTLLQVQACHQCKSINKIPFVNWTYLTIFIFSSPCNPQSTIVCIQIPIFPIILLRAHPSQNCICFYDKKIYNLICPCKTTHKTVCFPCFFHILILIMMDLWIWHVYVRFMFVCIFVMQKLNQLYFDVFDIHGELMKIISK